MRCVIYARYSSDGQREESVEGQLRECKEFAERKGITLVGTVLLNVQNTEKAGGK